MNEGRVVVAEFCDDIRQEVGHKFSLMGCYAGNELIADEIPIALPKLFASVTAISPLEKPFSSLVFRAFLNDELIAENEIPATNLADGYKSVMAKSNGYTRFSIRIQMGFVPLVIQEESILKIEAESEEGVINGAKLIIRKRTQEDPPLF
jgi:hypothetical protein